MENGVQGPLERTSAFRGGVSRGAQNGRWRPRDKAILLLEATNGP